MTELITAEWLHSSYGNIFKTLAIQPLPRMVIKDRDSGHYTYHQNMGGWSTPWHFFTSCLAKYATHDYYQCKIVKDMCFIFNRETGQLNQTIWFEY